MRGLAGWVERRLVTADAIYGLILYAALVGVISDKSHPSLEVLVLSVLSLLVFWGAHVYAATIANHGVRDGKVITVGAALHDAVWHTSGMLYAAILPSIPLVVAVFGGLKDDDAANLSHARRRRAAGHHRLRVLRPAQESHRHPDSRCHRYRGYSGCSWSSSTSSSTERKRQHANSYRYLGRRPRSGGRTDPQCLRAVRCQDLPGRGAGTDVAGEVLRPEAQLAIVRVEWTHLHHRDHPHRLGSSVGGLAQARGHPSRHDLAEQGRFVARSTPAGRAGPATISSPRVSARSTRPCRRTSTSWAGTRVASASPLPSPVSTGPRWTSSCTRSRRTPRGRMPGCSPGVPIEKAYAAACAKNSGPLLGHIDAESNARDMDLMRALLGDGRLNYLGFSYGTFFGAHYAKLFPKNVGRMVLDGPVDPSITEPVDFTTQMGGFESAFRAYLADCLTGTDCPFTGTLDTALTQVRALIAQVGTEGLKIKDGRTLDLSSLGTAISYPLYSRDSWPDLTKMFAQLQQGDATIAFEFADGYNGRNDDGTYSEENNVYTAALCLDGVFPDSLAGTRATMDTIAQAAPTIGAIFSYSDWVQVSIACQNWPYKSVLHPEKISAKGAAPIMVVGTTNDPATPYTGAQSLASQLDSGFLVTRTGEGHTAYGSGNACIDSTVDAYLVRGTVPAKDPQC